MSTSQYYPIGKVFWYERKGDRKILYRKMNGPDRKE
ncbi:hypothetical protein AN619_22190 [Thermotalea metallivorans]|uniref:Uncharacterized protein n=1 Tax=Thermotalea metallivorans TaxID=520762 RepID=A0A140L2D7_9FIRM|nr:hypothetical protein AN619_22190 [Thermotalea metallivorans]